MDPHQRLISIIDKIMTRDFRERAGNCKYSHTLSHASAQRIAWYAIMWMEFGHLADESMVDWAAKYEVQPPVDLVQSEPENVTINDGQLYILRKLMNDIGEYEEDSDSEDPEWKRDYTCSKIENRLRYAEWCCLKMNCESGIFGIMWNTEYIQQKSTCSKNVQMWINKVAVLSLSQIIRFYCDKTAFYQLGGMLHSFTNKKLKVNSYDT